MKEVNFVPRLEFVTGTHILILHAKNQFHSIDRFTVDSAYSGDESSHIRPEIFEPIKGNLFVCSIIVNGGSGCN